MKQLLLEAMAVAALGAALAFGANALSPRGLQLSRDYFQQHSSLPSHPAPAFAPTNTVGTDPLASRLQQKGLRLAGREQVLSLFHDPRYAQDLVLFVDARDDEHYQAGHIPGALQFDYYHPENYLGPVLQACQVAQQIVVYCNGGSCEDSELAATLLRDAGVDKEKLLVYGGGFGEWSSNHWPVEVGQRRSGQVRDAEALKR